MPAAASCPRRRGHVVGHFHPEIAQAVRDAAPDLVAAAEHRVDPAGAHPVCGERGGGLATPLLRPFPVTEGPGEPD